MKYLQNFLADKRRVRNFLVSYFLIGFLGMAIPFTKSVFEQLTGVTLIMSVAFILIFHVGWNLRFVLVSLLIALAGFIVEVIGVETGVVFGHYSYADTMGPKIMNTPLLIGLNWWMLIYCFYLLLQKSGVKSYLQPFAGAALMLIYDLLLEPVAITWNMWHWHADRVPLQNYGAWFLISLLFFFFLRWTKVRFTNKISSLLIVLQMLFFLLLNGVKWVLYYD